MRREAPLVNSEKTRPQRYFERGSEMAAAQWATTSSFPFTKSIEPFLYGDSCTDITAKYNYPFNVRLVVGPQYCVRKNRR